MFPCFKNNIYKSLIKETWTWTCYLKYAMGNSSFNNLIMGYQTLLALQLPLQAQVIENFTLYSHALFMFY